MTTATQTKLRPLGDRVVVEPSESEEVTTGGILLPETAKEKPQKGTILAVGPGRNNDSGKLVAMNVNLHDKVLFARYAGTEIKLNGNKVLILKESDILAVVED
ncbi:MAG: co-chaperone GroES [Aggregatilineales bacterium]